MGYFDIVLGNPPYVNVKRGIDTTLKKVYQKNYKTATKQFDLFTLFIEKGLQLSNNILTYIVPKPFINNENYEMSRKLLIERGLTHIVLGSKIFENADVENSIFISCNSTHFTVSDVMDDKTIICRHKTPISLIKKLPFSMINTEISPSNVAIFDKLQNSSHRLSSFIDITRGIEGGKSDNSITSIQNEYKLLRGNDVNKYTISYNNLYCNYDSQNISKFKPLNLYFGNKIMIRRVSDRIIATYDSNNYLTLNTIYCCKSSDEEYNLIFLCGILNSKLIQFWFSNMFVLTDKLFPYIRKSQLNLIPIPNTTSTQQLPIIILVNQILKAKQEDPNADTSEWEYKIDQLVYHLYGLTDEEIAVVGG